MFNDESPQLTTLKMQMPNKMCYKIEAARIQSFATCKNHVTIVPSVSTRS